MDSIFRRIVLAAVLMALAVIAFILFESAAPRDFPAGYSIEIPKGTTLSQTADFLAAHGFIRSETLFKIYATIIEKTTTGIKTGDYLFTGAESAYGIAYRLVKGLEGYPVAKVTIPEGTDSTQIADIIARQIPGFDTKAFLALATPDEGYLFPETYFWPMNVKPEQVVSEMSQQFTSKLATIEPELASSTRSMPDIVKMAAILEREASSTEDRRIVAGILWKRIDAGMPLQVDAAPDTYKHAGLTASPIANPGLNAIIDAAHPVATKHWYYLSDKRGVMHYAETLEGHAANKNKYLQ